MNRIRNTRRIFSIATVLATGIASSQLPASSPTLGSILPRGGQRGTELDVFFNGSRLADAREILYYSSGFRTVKLEVVKPDQVKVRMAIAADCRLGVHVMRVRTATGISDLRSFFVGALATVDEKEPNSDFASPQSVPLNSTVAGVVQNEDVDYYAVQAEKGQRISAEIEAMRLGVTIFDAYLAILNSARFELASSDDTALLMQDAACQIVAPETGTYLVQVRESSYGGNGNCHYRLHIGTFPRPTAVYPPGGKRGDVVELAFLGDAAKLGRKVEVTTGEETLELFAEDGAGIAPSANVFRVSDHGQVDEVEPNGDHASATAGAVPGAFQGIISEPGDVDHFRFRAEKGQVFEVELHGRRIRSPLDSVLWIQHHGGGGIASNDDSRGPDSYFRFTAPETKDYVIGVRDHLGKGGPDYVYRIEVRPVRPGLTLTVPRVARYSQERQSIAVPRGNRYATMVSVSRQNFGGEIVLELDGLPGGMTVTGENVAANLSSIPVLFEAAADAPIAGRLCGLNGRHVDEKTGIRGGFELDVDLLVGNPGQSVYLTQRVDRLAVAVTEEAPFELRIVEPRVPLVRDGSMGLRVVAERKEGFRAPIRLEMIFNPPGVSSQRGVTIAEGQTEASIGLNARGNAEIREWKIVVNGVATVGDGPIWVASQLASLRVAEPYLTLEVQKASAEQGQATELFCKVNHITKFAGEAQIRLMGLPHKVASEPRKVTAETKELSFPVTIAKDSPAGRHRSVFCQVQIIENGEAIVHSTGGTELRIDKPLPAPAPKPEPKPEVAGKAEAPAPPPAPKPATRKPLTRLEKLRLEYERRKREASGEGR